MKAIFEVEFNPEMMIDEETLNELYDGDWLKLMQFLYHEEGLGIFENELKLVKIDT